MGPIRRRLTCATLLAAPSAAMAEVCDKQAPLWDGTPVSAWAELLNSIQSPLVVFLLLITAIAVRFRSQWGGLAAVIGWSIYVFLLMQDDVYWAAVTEGCAGSPSIVFGVVTLICAGVVLYTSPPIKAP